MPGRPGNGGMGRGRVLTFAVACALSVANLYYNQPLLGQMARGFGVSEAQVGGIPTVSQIGYALGMLLLVPLGDVTERRRLILLLLGLVTLSLLGAAFAPSLALLTVACLAVGVTTVVPQMLIPFAVQLSTPEERGKTIGTIMSGLLLGILLSRTVAGFVGEWLGWRAMFAGAAGLMVLLALTLRFMLPLGPPTARLTYAGLLRSVATLAREQPVLREAAATGGLLFGAFSAFWATLVFLLESPAYRLGAHAAGLFGLVGAVGALVAPLVGRYADTYTPRAIVGVGIAVTLAAWVCFGLFGASLWGLVVGVTLLDFGVQAAHVSNQARIFALVPEASSRLNTVYMVTYFVGGSLGSLLSSLAWGAAGWTGVCLVGAGLTLLAGVVHSARRVAATPRAAGAR